MDKAETVAGSYFELSVKGKKTQSFTIHVRNSQTGKTAAPYIVYNVDFDKKTANIISGPFTDKFLEITPTTTKETTKQTEESKTKKTEDTTKETEKTDKKPDETGGE